MVNNDERSSEDSCSGNQLTEILDSQFFKALSDPSRLEILLKLVIIGNGKTSTEIAAHCKQTPTVVFRHLKVLKESGILAASKQGKEVFYTFRNKEVAEYLRQLAGVIEVCC